MFTDIFMELLQKKGITPYRVAKDTGISQGLMNDYKNGKKQPTLQNITKIADYLNCSVDYLLGRNENPDNNSFSLHCNISQAESNAFVYDVQNIAFEIKKTAKRKNITIGQLLNGCNLNINTISELSKGKQISYLSFATIADYLDCSVDYLLGRTINPDSHKL